MLWRQRSVQKLRELWTETPYDGLDCRLTTDRIKSYCVNIGGIGGFYHPPGEETNIPKNGAPRPGG